jgi:hypothetical protein
LASTTGARADPLPSWNDHLAKRAIISFVKRVTKEGTADFVPLAGRIAVFDNDGTLWSEQPIYFQFAFALARVKELVPQHPEWKTQQQVGARGWHQGAGGGGGEGFSRVGDGDPHRHDN